MAHHLSAIQPVWSFLAPPAVSASAAAFEALPLAVAAPVRRWSAGPDGRPRARWAIGRATDPDA